MSRRLFSNNAQTTLAGPISAAATSMSATSGGGSLFPAITGGNVFAVTLIKNGVPSVFEIVLCTARSVDSFTIVRAQEGTTALAWNALDVIALLPTAGSFAAFLQGADLQAQSGNFAIDPGGTPNVFVGAVVPALTAHVVGMPISFLAGSTNTGASTFNDGFGTAAILTASAAPLLAGMIQSGAIVTVSWDGLQFKLLTVNYEAFVTAAVAAERTAAANASNLSSGTVANARLPLAAAGPGVTIAADPGTTPSGPPGAIWYFY